MGLSLVDTARLYSRTSGMGGCRGRPSALDILPTSASISKLATSSVQTTFFLFLILFTVLLIAEVGIMVKAIKKGPAVSTNNDN